MNTTPSPAGALQPTCFGAASSGNNARLPLDYPMDESLPSEAIDFIGMFRRRKKLFCLLVAVATCLAAAITFLLPPIYKSTSTILIEEQEIPSELVMTTVTSFAEQRLEMIKQRIMSTSRLLEIINRFKLYADKRERWTTEELVKQMREDISLDYISAEVMDRRMGKTAPVTIAFTLSYAGKESPGTVQDVAQVLASLFLEENIKVRTRQVSEASSFFEDEMKRVKVDQDTLEARISQFKREHIDELPELLPVNRQSLNDIEHRLEQLAMEKRTLLERKAGLQTQLAAASPANQDTVELARRQLEEMKSQLAILRSKYSASYPDVIKMGGEVAEMEERVRQMREANPEPQRPDNPIYLSLSNELTSIEEKNAALDKQMTELEASAARYKRHIAASPAVEGEYRALLEERNSLEKKHLDLTAKYMESQVAQGLEKEQKGERFTIIDPAALPEQPFKPNRPAVFLIGMFLSVAASLGITMLQEYQDKAVHNPEDLVKAVRLPLLSTVPRIVTADDRRRQRRRRILLVALSLGMVVAILTAIHFLVMDLNVVLAKVIRKSGI